MKARVKLTGRIVDVIIKEIPQYGFLGECTGPIEYLITRFYDGENYYRYDELDFDVESFDYWTRLEHQYAGMAMQALIIDASYADNEGSKYLVEECTAIAHALVEQLKEKEERK